MSKIKWYKRDPNSALTGMMCLTLEERGAYNTILDLIYTHGGKVLDDDRFLSGWMRCDVRVWRRIKKTLLERGKLELENGHLTNLRATYECTEAISRVVHARQVGVNSLLKSRAQSTKNNELASTPVDPNPQPYAGATSTTTSTKKDLLEGASLPEASPKTKPQKTGTRLNPDWTIPQEWGDWADDTYSLSEKEIITQAHKFKNYWTAKPGQKALKLDWFATWKNWIINYKEGI